MSLHIEPEVIRKSFALNTVEGYRYGLIFLRRLAATRYKEAKELYYQFKHLFINNNDTQVIQERINCIAVFHDLASEPLPKITNCFYVLHLEFPDRFYKILCDNKIEDLFSRYLCLWYFDQKNLRPDEEQKARSIVQSRKLTLDELVACRGFARWNPQLGLDFSQVELKPSNRVRSKFEYMLYEELNSESPAENISTFVEHADDVSPTEVLGVLQACISDQSVIRANPKVAENFLDLALAYFESALFWPKISPRVFSNFCSIIMKEVQMHDKIALRAVRCLFTFSAHFPTIEQVLEPGKNVYAVYKLVCLSVVLNKYLELFSEEEKKKHIQILNELFEKELKSCLEEQIQQFSLHKTTSTAMLNLLPITAVLEHWLQQEAPQVLDCINKLTKIVQEKQSSSSNAEGQVSV
jgi:hypothetical protein